MTKQLINVGLAINDGTGDTLRSGAQKINANFTELYNSVAYTLPKATADVLGGVRVGNRLTIDNGILSAIDQHYTLPTASDSVLGGVKIDGSTITLNGSNQLVYTLPTATNSVLGGVKVDGTTITINNGTISSNLVSRTTVSVTSSVLAPGASQVASIVGYKAYSLFKIYTSGTAWVTLYTSYAARDADASRLQTVDPAPGSGVIAEVITTGPDTILISPGTIGFNDEAVPTTNIPIKIVNKSVVPAAITVTLTLIQLEK